MSNRVPGQVVRKASAVAVLILASSVLVGCTSLGSRSFYDPMTTSSVVSSAGANTTQAMPGQLGAPTRSTAKYLPPMDVGAQSAVDRLVTNSISTPPRQTVSSRVIGQDLPSLKQSPAVGSTQTMPTQLSTPAAQPIPAAPTIPTAVQAAPTMTVAAAKTGYTHVIQSGESLYSIARRYNVSTDTLVLTNGLASPDKIFVGQKIVVPGAQNLPTQSTARTAAIDTIKTSSVSAPVAPNVEQKRPMALPEKPTLVAAAPSVVAPTAIVTPTPRAQIAPRTTKTPVTNSVASANQASGKFRWPVSGKVITDFPASKGTGINIEVPEGTAIRAAETGSVIYVGSAVEGYGNLVLIKHDNGFVSAYAHLSQTIVSKGDTVMRGDAIGLAGMTGSVSKPQLHFELRKGATPVDPMPLLAS